MTSKKDFDYQILNLTDAFYEAYPNPPFTEILEKRHRAYNCLLLQTHQQYFICVPYRSHISHFNAFLFRKSARSRRSRSRLDYSKAVIIQNDSYVGSEDAVIDDDEYKETAENIQKIRREVTVYIDGKSCASPPSMLYCAEKRGCREPPRRLSYLKSKKSKPKAESRTRHGT